MRTSMKKVDRKTVRLFKKIAAILSPPPELTVSQWADEYRRLSPEASAEPGRWNTDRAPYQRDIMDAVNDARCEDIIIMSSAQVGKTELILNIIGYYIDYDHPYWYCSQHLRWHRHFQRTGYRQCFVILRRLRVRLKMPGRAIQEIQFFTRHFPADI